MNFCFLQKKQEICKQLFVNGYILKKQVIDQNKDYPQKDIQLQKIYDDFL